MSQPLRRHWRPSSLTPTHALSRLDPEPTRRRRSETGGGAGGCRGAPAGLTVPKARRGAWGSLLDLLPGKGGRRRGGNGYTGSRVTWRQKGLGALRLPTALQPPTHAGSPLHCPCLENTHPCLEPCLCPPCCSPALATDRCGLFSPGHTLQSHLSPS